ncbi:helicase-related protein [Oligosphaera ethanolica]|uniref:Superfamily II DNA or RNA helicase n=1 Tax=Oligosphaera ethanolica TaxID=760260 RepID=A0AAE3VCV3_9BACT|nr:helicase-related protein [Oligosphaera ethanolica]MDQ0288165.1 superfamily II DNA or RNA helicase [Oligosphaera ethanolica]
MSHLYTIKQAAALGEKLRELASDSTLIRVMGGFFYFSALKSFHDALAANPRVALRIIVGMDVELHYSHLVEINRREPNESNITALPGDRELIEAYLESLRTAMGAPELDIATFHERLPLFIDLLKNGRLHIRRSRNLTYARACLFDRDSGELFSQVDWLTGSIDLSQPKLTVQNQVQVGSRDFGVDELAEQFEQLWDDGVVLTEDPDTLKRILAILEHESIAAAVTPYEAYGLLLKIYLDLQKQVNASAYLSQILEDHDYTKYRYQLDAVDQALTILQEYNGVIIADVVGLGKSVVASLIINGIKKRGIIIAPPGLIGDAQKRESGWQDYKSDFRFYDWEIFSCGLLEDAWNYVKDRPDIEVVLIDEAHRFKNQETEDYETLSDICRGRKVILLTATPFNNRPADIFALLKLFVVPGCSNITLDDRLEHRFATYDNVFSQLSFIQKNLKKEDDETVKRVRSAYEKLHWQFERHAPDGDIDPRLIKKWSRKMAREIRKILEPIIIRRNRIDLRNDPDYRNEVSELSDMQPPAEQYFELTPEQSRFYDDIIGTYFGEGGSFRGCLYQPFLYEGKTGAGRGGQDLHRESIQQQNLYSFMCRLLVRRFESSFGAFARSIDKFIVSHEQARDFIRKHNRYIMNRTLLERLYAKDADDVEAALEDFASESDVDLTPRNKRVYEVAAFAQKDQFLADLDHDIALFHEVQDKLKQLDLTQNDPKAARLTDVVKAVLASKHPDIAHKKGEPKRKVIVFSEYADTVKHLADYLETHFPGRVLSVSGNTSKQLKQTLAANFDAGFGKKGKPLDQYDILVATDKMSEGHNLNRAGLVINYDIPWNPTRVIQRVGRINRIGNKVFQNLYIFNFFPTERGADINRSREIAAAKMFMIHNTIGEDAQIFDIDETPEASSLFRKLQQNPEDSEEESFLTSVKKAYLAMLEQHPDMAQRLQHLPHRIKTARTGDSNALYLFKRKGLGLFTIYVPEIDGAERLRAESTTMEEAFAAIQCDFAEPRLGLSEDFWDAYDEAKAGLDQFGPRHQAGGGDSRSMRVRALSNIAAALSRLQNDASPAGAFLPTLRQAIERFGALSEFTLRRLGRFELKSDAQLQKFLEQVEMIRQKLGDNYLADLTKLSANTRSEIIVAIETRRE